MSSIFQGQKRGIDFETKDSLMKKAEASGLSNRTLYGQGQDSNR